MSPGAAAATVTGGGLPFVLVDDARHFADELARASDQPVVYAELPGTQHNFDFFHSLRFHAVADAVESFVDCVHAQA